MNIRALLVGWLLLLAAPLAAQEQNDVILSVQLDRYVLSDGILAFQHDGEVLVPVAELAALLHFYVEVDRSAERIKGWVLTPERSFALDGVERTLSGRGGVSTLDGRAFLEDLSVAGEAYLPVEQLSEIWPVTFSVDLRRLRLIIHASEPLPVQLTLEREAARRAALSGTTAQELILPDVTVPYLPISGVVGHVESVMTLSDDLTIRNSANVSHDLLWSSANWAYGRTDSSDEDSEGGGEFLRFYLERRGMVGELPLGLEHVRIGDIVSGADTIAFDSSSGRGISLSSFGEVRDVFDEIDIQGDAPPDWEAELYINNSLIDFQPVSADGRFEFMNIPVQYGRNFVEVRLFGPHGEALVETRTIDIPPQASRRGEFAWALQLAEDRPLIGIGDEGSGRPWGQVQATYGLADLVTLDATVQGAETDDGTYIVGTIGLAAYLGDIRVKPELIVSHAGEIGASLSLARNTEFGHLHLTGEYLAGIETPALGIGGDALRYRGTMEYATSLTHGRGRTVLSVNAIGSERMSGESSLEVSARQITSHRGYNISNQIRLMHDDIDTRIGGRLLVAERRNQIDRRVVLDYDFQEPGFLTNGEVAVGYRSNDALWSATAGLSRDFRTGDNSVRASLSRRFDAVEVGLEASASDANETSISIRLSSTLGISDNGRTRMTAGNTAGLGSARLLVFIDENGNERFDSGDTPLPGIGIRANRQLYWARTGENGEVLVENLSSRHHTNLTIAVQTLEDPFLLPATEGVRLIARAGVLPVVEMPVMRTGSIDGTVISAEANLTAAGVSVVLLSPSGHEVARTTSAYDGYFAFDQVPLGNYLLAVAGDGDAIEVIITTDEPMLYGVEVRDLPILLPRNLQ